MLRARYPRPHVRPARLPVPREAPKAGFEAPRVDDPTLLNLHDYERAAAERLSAQALSYYVSGAMDERTLHDNRAAFARRRLLPRVMTDTSGDRHDGRGPGPPLADAALHPPDRAAPPRTPGR